MSWFWDMKKFDNPINIPSKTIQLQQIPHENRPLEVKPTAQLSGASGAWSSHAGLLRWKFPW